jgi:hypothetical protein
MEMSDKKFLTAAEILGAQDVEIREVDVPDWGGTVRLRTITAEEMASLSSDTKKESSVVALLVIAAVDEDGKALFTANDFSALKKKSLRPFLQLQKIVGEMNGLDDLKKGKELAEAKND